MRRRGMVGGIAALSLVAAAGPAGAQTQVIDAPTAQGLPGAGGVLVDIRTPGERRATGVPAGAVHVPLQGEDLTFNKDFVAQLSAAVGDDRRRPVALICAGGRRSQVAARLLAEQGYTSVFSVGEGMLGSNFGPGWLARRLPVEPCPDCGG